MRLVLLTWKSGYQLKTGRRELKTGWATRSQCEPAIAFVFTKATTRYRAGENSTDSDCFSAPERIAPACRIANCRIVRGKSAASTPCTQENKKQQTGWRWAQSRANSSPSKNSLLTGKNTGNLARWLRPCGGKYLLGNSFRGNSERLTLSRNGQRTGNLNL